MKVFRHSQSDSALVALSLVHGALMVCAPSAPLIALGMWWNANTISHNFIHLPFFRARWANAAFGTYLSALLGVPQTIWRDRHLAHHASRPWTFRWRPALAAELAVVACVWLLAASRGADFFLWTWVAGLVAGLGLCQLQGYFEHVRGTVSHYGLAYNAAFFNDGYHAEHHARPGVHWTALPSTRATKAPASMWPPVLRWLELHPLDVLERVVLRSAYLQQFVLWHHERAFARMLKQLPTLERITIVGGALFPRTVIVLRKLVPGVELTVVDRSAESVEAARRFLDAGVRVVNAEYSAALGANADLLVVPLAFGGDREQFYAQPDAPFVAVHDWIWRRRGSASFPISLLLLKRLNLVRR